MMDIIEPYTKEMIEYIRQEGSKICYCYRKRDDTCDLGKAEMYDHDGGVLIECHKQKKWLYFTFKTCRYQWAWHKILAKILEVKHAK